MPTHTSIFAWRMPWTEESGRLSPWGCEELDMTKGLNTHNDLNAEAICDKNDRNIWWEKNHFMLSTFPIKFLATFNTFP